MKRCLFGGSFDPVHMGHVAIAKKAREVCALDEVVFLPCAQSPLKEHSPVISDVRRVDMLTLALKGISWARMDSLDLELPPPSWSWRIAEHFSQKYPYDRIFWLMGTDQWNDLERWGRWRYLAGLVEFIVHSREGEAPLAREGVNAEFIHGDHPASSSEIRQRLGTGRSVPAGWLNDDVASYIAKNIKLKG